MRTEHVRVVSHDEDWHMEFDRISAGITDWLDGAGVGDAVVGIEHVGSTAVCGLWAKPIIDLDLVYADSGRLADVVSALEALGYEDEGELRIAGREAFSYSGKPELMTHHLYACPVGSPELARHRAFRDYLRTHPAAVREYSEVKREAASRSPDDIDAYIEAKSPCIERLWGFIRVGE